MDWAHENADRNFSADATNEGQANLRIIGTASNPVVIGRAEITSGDIFLAQNDYHVERGLITFANPNQTEPVLNVMITTTIHQYNLSITVRGPIQKLQTSYVSDPTLPPIDITFRCKTDYRGYVYDVDIERAQSNYGYNYTPYQNDYSQYGYRRY